MHVGALTDSGLIDLTSTSIAVKSLQEKVESLLNLTAEKYVMWEVPMYSGSDSEPENLPVL